MPEPPTEDPRPYQSLVDSQCRSATSKLLHAARFMSQDSDRRIFHRFDELRLFVLLRLQHRLRHEQESRTARGQPSAAKDDVLNNLAVDIGLVLKEYGMYMCFALLLRPTLNREDAPKDKTN